MATLNKHEDREDRVRWAIAFIRRGLWLDLEINVHGPHDRSGHMWGDAWAKLDSTGDEVSCVFFARARRSKYDPVGIRIFMGEVGQRVDESERFPLVKISQLTPQAQRYLRTKNVQQRSCARSGTDRAGRFSILKSQTRRKNERHRSTYIHAGCCP